MAEAAENTQGCLLCSEELSEPITLGCDHRFCSSCLRKHWAPSLTGDCPKCKRRWSKDSPPFFALEKELSQSQGETSGGTEKELSPGPASDDVEVSQGAPSGGQFEPHQFYVTKLKERRERTVEVMKQYKSMLEFTDRQTQQCDAQIRDQFRQIHEFLVQEEEMRLNELRKERLKKTQLIEEELKKLEDELGSLSDRISSAEQQGQSTDSSSLTEQTVTLLLTNEPELRSGLLLDQAGVLGNLGYRVWGKMTTIVNHSPVILDPNTAAGGLCLSEDLTSVRHEDTQLQLPLNPERFTNHSSVLGSKGFSSGRHQWEVEVGDHPDWAIGVAKESAERRSWCSLLPKEGFWCLKYCDNKYTDVRDKIIKLRRRPEKICVVLDQYGKSVSGITFYDSREMKVICSYHGAFTEEMFPYFSAREAGDTDGKVLKICQNSALLTKPGVAATHTDFERLIAHNRELEAENCLQSRLLELKQKKKERGKIPESLGEL